MFSSQSSTSHPPPGAFSPGQSQSKFRNSGFGDSFANAFAGSTSSGPFASSTQQQSPQHATRPLHPIPDPIPPSRPATLDARTKAAEKIDTALNYDSAYPNLDEYLSRMLSYSKLPIPSAKVASFKLMETANGKREWTYQRSKGNKSI